MRSPFLVVAAVPAVPALAFAATLNVNSTADWLVVGDGQCTLREAIINANGDSDGTGGDCAPGSGADLIHVPVGTYTLTVPGVGEDSAAAGDLDITGDLTLRGAGAAVTRIDAAGLDRVLHIHRALVSVEHVTITGGGFPGTPGYCCELARAPGGGILNEGGALTVLSSVVAGNRGSCAYTGFESFVCGAGILAVVGATAGPPDLGSTTTVRRSAVVNNDWGGIRLGLSFDDGQPNSTPTRNKLLVENSTISDNTQATDISGFGYRVFQCHGLAIDDTGYLNDVVLGFSTVSNNRSSSPYCASNPGWTGALNIGSGRVRASVISSPGCACEGCAESAGYNLDSDGTCGFTDPTDLSHVDPLLGPLQHNGGPMPTHALLRGSPAIDRIPAASCLRDEDGDPSTSEVALAEDQRGARRPREGNGTSPSGCDAGSYEVAACTDGLDNDGDGHVDFDGGATAGIAPLRSPDPNCHSALADTEAAPAVGSGCGIGPELLPALVMLATARRRLSRSMRRRSALRAVGVAIATALAICEEAAAQPVCLTFESAWGEAGAGRGQFNHPFGINLDADGNLYVADGNNHRIQKFTNEGVFLSEWGSFGRGPGQFNVPIDALVDRDGNVYVSDLFNNRIQKFTSTGAFLMQWGGRGSTPGKFTGPLGLALDESGNLWVADTGGNGRIQVFTSTGQFLFAWGAFTHLTSVALDRAGDVYVASTGDSTIKKFTRDGTFLTEWGGPGSGPGQFGSIVEVIVDPSGDVYVSDQHLSSPGVQKFTNTGDLLGHWGGAGSGDGQFSGAFGLALDPAGHLLVADGSPYFRDAPNNNRIQEFSTACPVDIDIKPGSATNPIHPFSHGVIPIAVLGSDEVDVQEIDLRTLAFGPGKAASTEESGAWFRDVDGDGFLDLIAHFRTVETGIEPGDAEACLTLGSVDGTRFEGCDAIRTVPASKQGAVRRRH